MKVGDRVRVSDRYGVIKRIMADRVLLEFSAYDLTYEFKAENPASAEVSVGIEKTCKRMAAIQLEKLETSGMTGDFGTQSEESRQAEIAERREARARTEVSGKEEE